MTLNDNLSPKLKMRLADWRGTRPRQCMNLFDDGFDFLIAKFADQIRFLVPDVPCEKSGIRRTHRLANHTRPGVVTIRVDFGRVGNTPQSAA